jgi:cell division protein FtsQ
MKIVKKILIILAWICLAGGIGFTVYYAYSQWISVRCQSIVVNINPNSPRFLDEDEIVVIIEKSGQEIVGQRLAAININKLESKLRSYTTFDNVQIFKKVDSKGLSFKGKLVVSLDERTPVVRFKNTIEDYYMDLGGIKVPVSQKYIERILLATGTLPADEKIRKDLLRMTDFINKDEFWKAQIEQVFIQENGELLMIPQVGDYMIEFGTPDDYQTKFRNLKALYQQGFKNFGWNKYKMISVKYRNQVVCTKK